MKRLLPKYSEEEALTLLDGGLVPLILERLNGSSSASSSKSPALALIDDEQVAQIAETMIDSTKALALESKKQLTALLPSRRLAALDQPARLALTRGPTSAKTTGVVVASSDAEPNSPPPQPNTLATSAANAFSRFHVFPAENASGDGEGPDDFIIDVSYHPLKPMPFYVHKMQIGNAEKLKWMSFAEDFDTITNLSGLPLFTRIFCKLFPESTRDIRRRYDNIIGLFRSCSKLLHHHTYRSRLPHCASNEEHLKTQSSNALLTGRTLPTSAGALSM
jgi:hypothetical protein